LAALRHPRRIRASLPALLASVGLIALAGCGEGDGEAAEAEVSEAVTEVATATDPEACTELVTEDYVEQITFSLGSEALALCELTIAQSAADSVDVSEVSMDDEDERATAEFEADGGGYDGLRLTFELVREEDRWKADRIAAVEILDRESFLEAQAEAAQEPPTSLSEEQAECLIDAIDAPDEEIEEAIVESDPTPFVEAAQACVGSTPGDTAPPEV
jgi:hypothetical protein